MAAKTLGKQSSASTAAESGTERRQCPTSVREVEYEKDVESVSEGWDIFGLEEGMRRQHDHRRRAGFPAAASVFTCWVFFP